MMKKIVFTMGLATLASAGVTKPVLAQPIVSPDVHPDGSVTFRYRAPNAREVALRCEGLPKAQSMEKDDGGVWSVRTPPLSPDVYVYSFNVDGQRVLDPSNPLIKYNLFATDSQVHVPGPAELPWEINDVPHGVVHRHHYRSSIIGDERDVWIYTPPGYDAAAADRYPVLYLLHGYSDAEDTWVTVGRANVIFDNLIARRAARPTFVVMPRGYGNREVIAGGWMAIRGPEGQRAWQDSNARFGASLTAEIIPLVEANYRVIPGPEARAIAGLSMGGTQALLVGLGSPERFAWIASFSAGGLPGDLAGSFSGVDARLNSELRLLWIGCGTEDGLIANNRQLVDWLSGRGVRHSWVETPGRHSFLVWRRYLAQVAPLLFQPRPAAGP